MMTEKMNTSSKKYLSRPIVALATTALIFSVATAVDAASTQTTLNVSATVEAACTVTASALAFGKISYVSGVLDQKQATSTVTVSCDTDPNAAPTILVGNGSNFTTIRGMAREGGGANIFYNLFDGALVSEIGTNTPSNSISTTGSGTVYAATITGQIAPGQRGVGLSNFSDAVQLTVTYAFD